MSLQKLRAVAHTHKPETISYSMQCQPSLLLPKQILSTHLLRLKLWRLTRAGIPRRAPRMDEWAKSMPETLEERGCVGPAVASRQGGLIFKMSPGLFRFLTKGSLVRQANVWTAVPIVARLSHSGN